MTICLVVLPFLVSCEKEGCFVFQFDVYTEIYIQDTLYERRQNCVYNETICGISYHEAKTYAKVSSRSSVISDYLVFGSDVGNLKAFEVREVSIIEN